MLQGLEEPPDDITDKDGSNALHNAVYHLQLDIARFLIGLGCNVNLQSRNGDAPLHLVGEVYRNCCGQVEEVVEVLVQAGADTTRGHGDIGDDECAVVALRHPQLSTSAPRERAPDSRPRRARRL